MTAMHGLGLYLIVCGACTLIYARCHMSDRRNAKRRGLAGTLERRP